MLTTYKDPHQADNIMKIQKELDETKIVLHKTIESVLQRGEKIDDLVQKSDGLSSQSKMFYRKLFADTMIKVLMMLTFPQRTSKEAELVLVSLEQYELDGPKTSSDLFCSKQPLTFPCAVWSCNCCIASQFLSLSRLSQQLGLVHPG